MSTLFRWLIVLFLYSAISWSQATNTTPVSTVEYQALIDFYNAVNGDNWNTKWDISINDIHLGNWHGVESEDGHITAITLSRNRLIGAIPASFGNLKFLKRLNLYGHRSHDLSTTDLSNLSGLESLEELRLNSCRLTGVLPAALSKLTKLRILDVGINTLEGPLFDEIGELVALESINISSNQITSIPTTINTLVNLETFNAVFNKISGSLIKSFEALTKLRSLSLNSNELSTVDAFLASSVSLNIRSQRIRLDSLTYRGTDVVIDSLPNIVRYNRSTNDFSHLPTFSVFLRRRSRGNITMNADHTLTIPKDYLTSARFGDELFLRQVNSGAANGTEIRFDTFSVQLPIVPDEEFTALVDFFMAAGGPNWVQKWPIETNDLDQGAWHGITLDNGHVTGIELDRNTLRGSIPASFSNLKFLKRLSLYGFRSHDLRFTNLNNLSGLESLEYLDLRYCQLTGEIPASWSNLKNLKELNVSSNNLEGAVPDELGTLVALETMNMFSNQLTRIPTTIDSLTNLKTLIVSINQLTSLPTTLGNLPNLETLEVANNSINGSLIASLENIETLQRLLLNGNELTDIDAFLAPSVSLNVQSQRIQLDSLTYRGTDVVLDSLPRILRYNRSANDFSHLPTFRVFLRNRGVGDVTMDETGKLTIPDSYLASMRPGDDVFLEQVSNSATRASRIRFTTVLIALPMIPDEEYQALVDFYNATNGDNWVNKWPVETNNLNEGPWYGVVLENGHVTEINLDRNRLVGTIPASFSDLKFLKRLYLYGHRSHNLTDTDLNHLSGLESLEYLNLNSCQIKDTIPASFAQLTKLKVMDMGINNLEGALFEEIGEMVALETIKISGNKITSIPDAMNGLINVKEFDAFSNQIRGSLVQSFEGMTALTRLQVYDNELTDVEAFLASSVSLSLHTQRIRLDSLTYRGEDLVIDRLPPILRYDRRANDFSHLPTLRVFLRNRNVGDVRMNEDGTLVIPKTLLASMRAGDDVYLQQINGALNATTIRFDTISVVLPTVPDEEYQALVDFYTEMNGDNWINKWPVETNNLNEGAWYGVSLEDGHVTTIILDRNRVNGAIPASFGDLKFLRQLHLYGHRSHDLSTTNLEHLSALESLASLDLRYCKLTGVIPASWDKLLNLKTVRLDNNEIEDVATAINALKPDVLNLQSQNISFESIEVGADKIFIDLPAYMTLQLSEGNITFDAKNEFRLYVNEVHERTAFSNNGQLIFSNLSQLNIEESDRVRVFQVNGIASSSNLNYNAVSFGRPLVDEEFEILRRIYETTGGENWTSQWDITENNVNKVSWYGVSVQDGHVVGLSLFNNQLSGTIPEEIVGLTALKTLNVSDNNLTGTIPVALDTMTSLEVFDINSNQIGGAIPASISNLENLKKFAIANNQFSGTIPAALSDFVALEHLDISGNGFDKIDKKLYYDPSTTYIDLRNQQISYDTILTLNDTVLEVELSDIVTYDLVTNTFEGRNTFSLLVNNLTHDTTMINEAGEIVFSNVRINEIPSDATIVVRQTSGSFFNTEFTFAGIDDKSNVPLVAQEYTALRSVYTALNGDSWTTPWDITANNVHEGGWHGVTIYDGHVVGIDLSANNVTGTIPAIVADFPQLAELDLSSNAITSVAAVLPTTIDIKIDRQLTELGDLVLSREALIQDDSVNRYDHAQQRFINQTYQVTIGDFSRTINVPEEGIRLTDLMTHWRVPKGEKIRLRQQTGNAINSSLNYDFTFVAGDANLDSLTNILDIQTTINHILRNPTRFFNFYAADMNEDTAVNILDVTAQVNAIQSGGINRQPQRLLAKRSTRETAAQLRLVDQTLLLDTNGHEVTSFEIILEGVTTASLTELVSDIGFSTYVKEYNNQLSLVAFSLGEGLSGSIPIATFDSTDEIPSIKDALLSNKQAEAVPYEIINAVLGVPDHEAEELGLHTVYPNPFRETATITFVSDRQYTEVLLRMYNLAGQEVVAYPLQQVVSGVNTFQFKRGDLASGTYFYRIRLKRVKHTTSLKGKITIK